MKRFLTVLLVVTMLVSAFGFCPAYAADESEPAYVLNKLGLFNGTGTDGDGKPVFGLENFLTRQEATTLLVRLLGKEEKAKKELPESPFTDVDEWAKPYVGYAYTRSLVNGLSDKTFGANKHITATEYLTLILRALGYNEKNGDFVWDSAWTLSDKIEMTKGEYHKHTNQDFRREDAAYVSYRALLQEIKGEGITLAKKLLDNGVITKEQIESTKDVFLKRATGLSEETKPSGVKVAAVEGITFEQRGVYVKMTLIEPQDKTGIKGYEAIIYDKNNPDGGLHRTIAEDGTAHYRMDNPEIFVPGYDYNTIKVTSVAEDGYTSSSWKSDITIVSFDKEITVSEAWMSDTGVNLSIENTESGFMAYIFTRKDGSVVDEDTYFNYQGNIQKYRSVEKKWSDEDKEALANGEISVALKGMNIVEMSDYEGNLKIVFERINAPAVQVKKEAELNK